MEPKNDDTVQAAAAGDDEAFARLVRRHTPEVWALVCGIVRNDSEAEEIVQDVFVKVWRKLPAFGGRSAFSTWLYRIACNEALSHLRRRRPATVPVENLPLPDPSDEASESCRRRETTLSALETALERLSPSERMLVELFYRIRLPVAEVAAASGLSAGNVKVKLHRIRKRLERLLNELETPC